MCDLKMIFLTLLSVIYFLFEFSGEGNHLREIQMPIFSNGYLFQLFNI